MVRFTIEANEFNKALRAIQNLTREMPASSIGAGDARCALIRTTEGASIITCSDVFTAEIKLTITFIGTLGTSEFDKWDGRTRISPSMLIGFASDNDVKTLISRVDEKTVEVEFDRAKNMMTVRTTKGRFNFTTVEPRLIATRFQRPNSNVEKMCELNGEQAEWLTSTMGKLASIVPPSSSQPGFGTIVVSAYPSEGEPLNISGSSDAQGFSIDFRTTLTSGDELEMLVPRPLAAALKGFVTEIGKESGGAITLGVVRNAGTSRAKTLVFQGGRYMVAVACDDSFFPFKSIAKIAAANRDARARISVPYKKFQKMLQRVKAGSDDKLNAAVTHINVSDGGVLELKQFNTAVLQNAVSEESIDVGNMTAFPDDVANVSVTVKTSVLMKVLPLCSDLTDLELIITNAPQGQSGKLVIWHDYGIAQLSAVMVAVRTR